MNFKWSCPIGDCVLSKASILEDYVFRDSGNFGAGGYHSGDIIFTQNIEPGPGKNTGGFQTGGGAFWKNAPGHRCLRPLAGRNGSLYAALER